VPLFSKERNNPPWDSPKGAAGLKVTGHDGGVDEGSALSWGMTGTPKPGDQETQLAAQKVQYFSFWGFRRQIAFFGKLRF